MGTGDAQTQGKGVKRERGGRGAPEPYREHFEKYTAGARSRSLYFIL